MKKILLSAMVLMVLTSCGESSVTTKVTNHKLGATGSIRLTDVEIEGCEYFFCERTNGIILTHKGNCSNPIHAIR
jgi:secreted PhoX family phosphatase